MNNFNTATIDPTVHHDGDRRRISAERPSQPMVASAVRALLVAFLLSTGIVTATSTGVASATVERPADYTRYQTDSFRFWDGSGNKVNLQGYVGWFRSSPWPGAVYRGQYESASVVLNTTGCLWVKVTWHTLTGSLSWPPSGSANAVSDGYYRACGSRGTRVSLNGVSYASRSVFATSVCVGFSYYDSYTLRRFDSCSKMWN